MEAGARAGGVGVVAVRFLPLIIDEEHAERTLPLLLEVRYLLIQPPLTLPPPNPPNPTP